MISWLAPCVRRRIDLRRVAEALGHLQVERHRADYDHTYDARRPTVLTIVDEARDAVQRVRRLNAANEASYRLLLRLMIGAVKVAKRR